MLPKGLGHLLPIPNESIQQSKSIAIYILEGLAGRGAEVIVLPGVLRAVRGIRDIVFAVVVIAIIIVVVDIVVVVVIDV